MRSHSGGTSLPLRLGRARAGPLGARSWPGRDSRDSAYSRGAPISPRLNKVKRDHARPRASLRISLESAVPLAYELHRDLAAALGDDAFRSGRRREPRPGNKNSLGVRRGRLLFPSPHARIVR